MPFSRRWGSMRSERVYRLSLCLAVPFSPPACRDSPGITLTTLPDHAAGPCLARRNGERPCDVREPACPDRHLEVADLRSGPPVVHSSRPAAM